MGALRSGKQEEAYSVATLLDEIKLDIVNDVSIATVLRKTKILAYRLGSTELISWIDCELDGYPKRNELPAYRRFGGVPQGEFTNGVRVVIVPIPMRNLPAFFSKWEDFRLATGVAQIEALVRDKIGESKGTERTPLMQPWPGDLIPELHFKVVEGFHCMRAWTVLPEGELEQLLDSVRNKLLSFLLELEDRYPEIDLPGFKPKESIPKEEVQQMVQYYIFGLTQNQGGTVTTFNQQNQQVSGNQYNSGRDINFSNVHSKEDLLAALEELRAEIEAGMQQGVLDEEPAIDASNEVRKAIQKTKKDESDKEGILDHLKNTGEILKGVASAAALLPLLQQAIGAVAKVIRGGYRRCNGGSLGFRTQD